MKREWTYSHEALAQRAALLNEMTRIADRMKQATGTPELDELIQRHEALEKRYDTILPTEQDRVFAEMLPFEPGAMDSHVTMEHLRVSPTGFRRRC